MAQKWWYPFSITEEQVRKQFLEFLVESETMPLDAVANVKIDQIEPQFRLLAHVRGLYYAHWRETCFWERTENYTEYTSKIVYVKDGRE